MALKISVSSSDPIKSSAELLVVAVTTENHKKGLARELVRAVGKTASRALSRGEFKGARGQMCDLGGGGTVKASRVLLVGLGAADQVGFADMRRAAAVAARLANSQRCHSMAMVVLSDSEKVEEAVAQGAVFGTYRFEQYKSEDARSKHALKTVSILRGSKIGPEQRQGAKLGQAVAAAVCRARDLINMPPNELYPEALAAYSKAMCTERKTAGLSCTVMKHKQILAKGMNLIDAVGRGSRRGPVLIHMKYRPPGVAKDAKLKRLVFVGKGITFDTGGICIKPGPGMDDMKGDMGGAANVVALMAAVAETAPHAEIHGIVASAENMPDGDAYRPADIFTAYSGKTVEIINTDAEGRLVLADALHYATELEPDFLLDNATLTGACMVALGPTVSAVYSNRDALAEKLTAAAKKAGEAMWHMPLVEDLRDMLKSEWADVKHVGERWGGSITAALFLREFVGDTPWIHVDVAGPSMATKNYDIYSKGGTGAGVLAYLELIDTLIASDEA